MHTRGERCESRSKRAQNGLLSLVCAPPNGVGSLWEKRVFDPFLTHFSCGNGPFSRHFGIFHGPKRATTGSQRPKNNCLSIQTAHIKAIFGHFWALFRTFRGVRGQQRAHGHGAIGAHVKCSNRLPSFVRFESVSGPFWAKKGYFGAQNAQFWEGTSRLGTPAPGRHRCVFDSKLGFGKATT